MTTMKVRIFRYMPGMWVIIDTNYATYSASTWRSAMDSVSPPARKPPTARIEIHQSPPIIRAFNAHGEQTYPPPLD